MLHQKEEQGIIFKVDKHELKKIKNAKYLTSTAIIDSGNYNQENEIQLIPRMFRMSGFLAMNIPIMCAMILTKPTMINTVMT